MTTTDRKTHRNEVIQAYQVVAARAVEMGYGNRVCTRGLQSLSANEIEHMTKSLECGLNKLAPIT